MKVAIKNILCFGLPLVLIYFVFIRPILTPGLIVGGDWIFPYSAAQLKHYGLTWNRLWNDYTLPTGSQIPHKNLYLYELLALGFSILGTSGVTFQKTIICLIILSIFSFSFLLFHRITKNLSASLIGAMAYLFSPLVFNYFIMGWNFVLLFLGLMPLFVLCLVDFIEKDSYSKLIWLSIISAIAFFQSQSLFWIPVLILLCFLSYLPHIGFKKCLYKALTCGIAIGLMTALVHAVWYYPISLFPEKNITASTSSNDVYRFSVVSGLHHQLIGWGSLWNEQFEISFSKWLKPVSYLPIISLITLIFIINRQKKPDSNEKFVVFSLLLILTAPFFFIFRYPLAGLPLSTIIRDSSRFIIFTNLGFSLGICILWDKIKNNGVKIFYLVALTLLIHPFLLNQLFIPGKSVFGVSETGKDQRIRFLTVPWEENERLIASEKPTRGIYFPTGGFVTAKTDSRFKTDFSWIGDHDTFYSESISGFLISDKSNSKTAEFSNYYLSLANNNKVKFKKLSQIYGIDKIFVRRGLVPTDPSSPGSSWTMDGCKNTDIGPSDWSIGRVCTIPNPYPLIYANNNPQIASSSSFYASIKGNQDKEYIVSVECEDKSGMEFCNNSPTISIKNKKSPNVSFTTLDQTKYKVNIENIDSSYILVLNQTFHPGWVIENEKGERIQPDHILVNQLVNGWYIPFRGSSRASYIIEFIPEAIFQRLIRVSQSTVALIIIGSIVLYYFERRRK